MPLGCGNIGDAYFNDLLCVFINISHFPCGANRAVTTFKTKTSPLTSIVIFLNL